MSFYEILIIGIIAILLIKPEDIPVIIKKFKQFKRLFTTTKEQIYSQIKECADFDEESKAINPKVKPNELSDEIIKVNYYLNRLAELGIMYDGEYDLDKIKEYYNSHIKTQIKNKLKS